MASGVTRYVRTQAGAKFYGLPIGSVIGSGGPEGDPAKAPVTFARLLSIKQMAKAALRVGDESAAKYYEELLHHELGRASANPALQTAVNRVLSQLFNDNVDHNKLTGQERPGKG